MMTYTSLHRLAGIFVILVVSGGLYWFVDDFALAAVTGLTWGSGLIITLRIARQYPSHTTGDSWRDKRWTGLSTGLITLAALVGVSPALPISPDLRLGLGLLVIGAGFVGYTAGTMAELERKPE
jgi:hypothetical protein